jgi:hypothetical protein
MPELFETWKAYREKSRIGSKPVVTMCNISIFNILWVSKPETYGDDEKRGFCATGS